MTLPEIYAALPPPTPPYHEIVEQAKAYKKLTAVEKLDLARFVSDCG